MTDGLACSANTDHEWPAEGLSRIPDWVYTDETIYRREIERIFHGRTWNYVALEAELAKARRFHPLQCRSDPGRGRARSGRRDPCGGEPLRASCRGILPRTFRQREGVRLPLSPMDL